MANFFSKITNLFSSSDSKIEDHDAVVLQNATKGSGKPTEITAKAAHAGMVYNASLSKKFGEESYTPVEYDLSAIANCIDTDSYFRRAVEKYVELIWKAGYTFYGKNPRAVSYIRKRFEQIAMVTNNPTELLFRDISYQLVQYANTYISKVRKEEASGGRTRVTFTGQELKPVAGYFVEDSVSMRIAVKDNGDVIGYKQMIPGTTQFKVWKPWNIIHITHSKKPGLRVGTPMVWPVLDDIRALRRIEQNVELLVYQHTIPLFQYIVGTPERPALSDEITTVKATVEGMPPNGCIVTPERHTVKAIGVEKTVVDASVYLEYYKNRVLSGLGMSGLGMGDGSTTNRGTAVVLDKHLINTTISFQQIIKIHIDEFMIKELLAEGGFDTTWINEDNKVGIFFPPIDTEEQRAKENHYSQMYAQGTITQEEMRHEFGREPFSTRDRQFMYDSMVTNPKAEFENDLAIKLAKVGGTIKAQTSGKASPASKSAANKEQPANQYGKQTAKPKFPQNDEIQSLIGIISDTKDDLIDACIDSVTSNIDISTKLSSIKKYTIDNSKDIITKKLGISNLENKEVVYKTAIDIIDNIYNKFVAIHDNKHIDELTVKISALTDTLSNRLEVYIK